MKASVCFMLAAGLTLSACQKDDNNPTPEPGSVEEAVENIIAPLVGPGKAVGAGVLVVHPKGEEFFFFGENKKGENRRPDENTLFEIGSITKVMTGTLLADMVLEKKLSLDETVASFFPELASFPQYQNSPMLLRHLANHSSGLPENPDDIDDNNFLSYGEPEFMAYLRRLQPERAPGAAYAYSNTGFALLGQALKRRDERATFQDLLLERLFRPLGMSRSFVYPPVGEENIAWPHFSDQSPAPLFNLQEFLASAGVVKSSLRDMAVFLNAAMGKTSTALKPAFELAQTPTFREDEYLETGLGWIVVNNRETGKSVIWHNGGTAGTFSFLGFDPKTGVGVVLYFNTDLTPVEGEGFETIKGLELIVAVNEL